MGQHCPPDGACQVCCQIACTCLGIPGSVHILSRSPHDAALGAALDPTMQQNALPHKWQKSLQAYLFPHWFWIGDSCREKAIPLQSAIETCPVIVSVARVGEAPWDEGAKLFVHGITWLPFSTRTHTTKCTIACPTILDIFVRVSPASHANTKKYPYHTSYSDTHSFLAYEPSESRTSMLGRSLQSAPGPTGI